MMKCYYQCTKYVCREIYTKFNYDYLGGIILKLRRLDLYKDRNFFEVSQTGDTILHCACMSKSSEVVHKLLDIDNVSDLLITRSLNGRTPLHESVISRSVNVVKVILDEYNPYKVSKSLRMYDEHEYTPLGYACLFNLDGIVDLIINFSLKNNCQVMSLIPREYLYSPSITSKLKKYVSNVLKLRASPSTFSMLSDINDVVYLKVALFLTSIFSSTAIPFEIIDYL